VAISVITLAELRYGAECSSKPESNHQAVDDLVGGISILPVDSDTATVFATAKAELRKKGLLIEDLDLLIAATAQVHGSTLVTNNESHFGRVTGLLLENWTQT
jgi:tRNA(fMet)-specific endonuclease VapC